MEKDEKITSVITVGTQTNMVTVFLAQYVEKNREYFFETLSDILDKHLLKEQNKTRPAVQLNKKTAFQDMLSHAEQRAKDLNDQSKTVTSFKK